MEKAIDTIKIIYTPKKQVELQTFLAFYPIISGIGSCITVDLKHSDGTATKWNGLMESNVEYQLIISVYSFAKYLNPDKMSHP